VFTEAQDLADSPTTPTASSPSGQAAVIIVTAYMGGDGGYRRTVTPEQAAKRIGGVNILSSDQGRQPARDPAARCRR
jgi:hypothetical protein